MENIKGIQLQSVSIIELHVQINLKHVPLSLGGIAEDKMGLLTSQAIQKE